MGSEQSAPARTPISQVEAIQPTERKRDIYIEIEGILNQCRPIIPNIKGTRLEQIRDIYRFVITEMLKPRLICDIGLYNLYEYNGRYYIRSHHWPNRDISDEFDGGRIVSGTLYDRVGVWAKERQVADIPAREMTRMHWVHMTVRGRHIICTNNKNIPMSIEIELQ